MVFSNEAVIGLVSLFIMCVPLAAYILRRAVRAWRSTTHRTFVALTLFFSRLTQFFLIAGRDLTLSRQAEHVPHAHGRSPTHAHDIESGLALL